MRTHRGEKQEHDAGEDGAAGNLPIRPSTSTVRRIRGVISVRRRSLGCRADGCAGHQAVCPGLVDLVTGMAEAIWTAIQPIIT
jgi:hypothetical protein